MAYGMKGHMAISAQQSFGTATDSWDYFTIISESLTTDIEQLVEEGMRGRFDEGPTQEGLLTVAGDIVFEPHPTLFGHMLRGVTGQASGTLVSSVTTWEFLPTQSDFTEGVCALPPFTLQVFRDAGSAWQFTDAVVNGLTVEVAGGTIKRATANILARVSSLMTATTPSYETGSPWTWDASSISIAGAANSDFENYTFNINNNLEGVATMNATKLHAKYMRTGYRTWGLSGTLCFADQTEYNAFRASTQQRYLITVTGATITGSQTNDMTLDMPQLRYTSMPINIGGPGRISATFEGNPKFDTTSSYAFRATMVNTRETYEN